MNEISYTDPGSIDGLLVTHNGAYHLTDIMIDGSLFLAIPGLPTELKHTIRRSISKRVAVTGMIHYVEGKPKSISVESIELLPEEKDIPKYKDLPVIDITGGVESCEWLRRQREE